MEDDGCPAVDKDRLDRQCNPLRKKKKRVLSNISFSIKLCEFLSQMRMKKYIFF